MAQAPAITGYSTSKVCGGGNFTVTITTTNNPTSYQWWYWFGGVRQPASDGILFSGSGTATLTVLDGTSWAGSGSNAGQLDLEADAINGTGSSSPFYIQVYPGAAPTASPVFTQSTLSLCAGSNNILYAVQNTGIPGLTWSYSGTGATIAQPADTAVLISFSGTATSGTLSVGGTDSCGIGPTTSIAVTVNSATVAVPAGTAGGPAVCASQNASVNTYSSPTDCSIIATIVPSGASPISGIVGSCATADGSVQNYHGLPYVQRHFSAVPANNESTATGTVTLYFTQSDFTNYNSARGSAPALPTGPTDAAGIANLRVTSFLGDGNGAPVTYTSANQAINPSDNNIVWNSISNRWEVTFAATGFGGFFVSGDTLNVAFPVVGSMPDHILACGTSGATAQIFVNTQNADQWIWQLSEDQGNSWSIIVQNADFTPGQGYLLVNGNDTLKNDLIRLVVTNTSGADTSSSTRIVINDAAPGSLSFVNPDTAICQGQTQLYSVTGGQSLDSIFFNFPGTYTQTLITDTFALVNYNVGPMSSTGYVRATNACGFGPGTVVPLTIYPSSTDSANAVNTTECSTTPVYPGVTTSYTDSTCHGIDAIDPSGASPVSGNVQSCVTVQNSVQSFNGVPYVPRYYAIEPASNASTSTATITLYFTQADFDAYNAARGSNPALPTGPSDATGIANVTISQFHGTGTTPDTYVGTAGTIIPTSVTWNSAASRWEVSFSVTGFSGFFVSGGSIVPLPLTLVSFTGQSTTAGNVLHWETTMEENTADFEVQRQAAGENNFQPIATVPAAGNSDQPRDYTYTDATAGVAGGAISYRLKMADLNGNFSYSRILTLEAAAASGLSVRVSPNPFHQPAAINVTVPETGGGLLTVTDVAGHRVAEQTLMLQRGTTSVDPVILANLAPGVYFLSVVTGQEKQTIQLLRQ